MPQGLVLPLMSMQCLNLSMSLVTRKEDWYRAQLSAHVNTDSTLDCLQRILGKQVGISHCWHHMADMYRLPAITCPGSSPSSIIRPWASR
jgi:hypothetical protein